MSNIKTNLAKLRTIKADLKDALALMGYDMSKYTFSDYASLIKSIKKYLLSAEDGEQIALVLKVLNYSGYCASAEHMGYLEAQDNKLSGIVFSSANVQSAGVDPTALTDLTCLALLRAKDFYLRDNPNITKISIPEGITSMLRFATDMTSLTSVEIANDLAGCEDMQSAFSGCKALKDVQIKTALPSVTNASYLFNGCTSLASLTMPEMPSVTNASYLFNGCTSLKSIALPDEMPNVENVAGMLSGCTALTTFVKFPDMPKVTSLSVFFNGCTALTEVFFPEAMDKTTNLSSMLRSTKVVEIAMPKSMKSCTSVYGMFDSCSSLKTLTMPDEMPELINAEAFCSDATQLRSVVMPKSMPKLQKMGGVRSWGYGGGMFQNCKNLISITLPDELPAVTTMQSTFQNCSSLASLTMPTTMPAVTNMQSTFQNCSSLASLTMPTTMSNVTEMKNIFGRCIQLAEFTDLGAIARGYDKNTLFLPKVQKLWKPVDGAMDKVKIVAPNGTLTVFTFGNTSVRAIDMSECDTSNVTTWLDTYVVTGAVVIEGKFSVKKISAYFSSTLGSAFTDMRVGYLKDLGVADTAINLADVPWGVQDGNEDTAEAKDSLIWSLFGDDTYTGIYDRSSGTSLTLQLSAQTKALLTEDQLNELALRGYTIA